jgi:hypothetical protein
MKWEDLVSAAGKEKIRVVPVIHPWWGKFVCKINLHTEVSTYDRQGYNPSGGRSTLWALRTQMLLNPDLNVGRVRIENRHMGLFFETADDAATALDYLLTFPDDTYIVDELHCPINQLHTETMNADFPTQVRSTLFQDKYRYRIVASIPWGLRNDSSRLDSMMDTWTEWEKKKDGEISDGCRYRFEARKKKSSNGYANAGIMSFYTDDQELSFIMRLSYPEFHKTTEKAVTLKELENANRTEVEPTKTESI